MLQNNSNKPLSVGVVGATGYTGIELLRLLAGHSAVQVSAAYASARAGDQLTAHAPQLRSVLDLELLPATAKSIARGSHDAVFLCTPHEPAAKLTPAILDSGAVVLDLSAAFRLTNPAAYPRHYGFDHPAAPLLSKAVYALPELNRSKIASGNLLACPGCYPTSAILPTAPLLAAGLLDLAHPIIIDSTSGVSGAGRKAVETSSFCQVSQRPYSVFTHRHTPEIAQELVGAKIIFTPHLGPFPRGIATTLHAQLNPGVSLDNIYETWQEAYDLEPFVRIRASSDWPGVSDVAHTNFIDMAAACNDSGHLIVCSAIDNLLKGAAGQALQAFNTRYGFPETLGLLPSSSLGTEEVAL